MKYERATKMMPVWVEVDEDDLPNFSSEDLRKLRNGKEVESPNNPRVIYRVKEGEQ